MKKLTALVVCFLFVAVQLVNAQQKTISGKVTGADDGLGIPGVSVSVEGTTIGTITNVEGDYTLEVPGDAQILVFSFVGMQTQNIEIGTSSVINVLMEGEVIGVDEVVITGYSTRKKEVATSAVAIVGADDLALMAPSTSIDNMLQGKAAGVDATALNGKPGSTATIKVRGAISLNATGGDKAQPLYVVDGVFFSEDDLNAINPSDIESMTVLKDASAAALYGSRGANGVIVINTKQGKKGQAVINYTGRWGFSNKIDDPYDMMNVTQKMDYEEAAYGFTFTPEERTELLGFEHNWQDDILKQAFIQSHSVSASGGNDISTYFMSFGFDENTGIVEKLDGFERLSARINTNNKLTKRLTVGTTTNISQTISEEPRDRNNVQNPFRAMYDYNPYTPVYQYDGNGDLILDANGDPYYNYTVFGFPILEALENNPETEQYMRLIGSAFAKFEFFEGFDFLTKYSGTYSRYKREYYNQPNSVLDGYVGDPTAPGSKTDNGRDTYNYTWLNQLTWKKSFGSHNVDLSGFTEFTEGAYHSYSLSSKGYASPDLTTQDNAAEATGATTSREEYALFSIAALGGYDYEGKYMVSGSVRRDGASRFGADNKYGVFFSISGGWNMAKESFMANASNVDLLKLNLSYGTLGNWNIPNYASIGYYSYTQYDGQSAALINTNVANPELTWEAQKSFNLGFEGGFFGNRLNAAVDYFSNTRTDFLFDNPLAYEGGGYSQYINAGEMVTNGLEVSASGDIFKTSDFTWNLGANFTWLDYNVKELNGQEQIVVSGISVLKEGEEPFTFYLPRYKGVDSSNGDAIYIDADGNETNVFSSGDAVVLSDKSPLANIYGGFNTYLAYRGLDVSADFSFKSGNYSYNYMAYNMLSDGDAAYANQRVDALDYWTPTNPDASLPALNGNSNQVTDRFLQDASYVRFRSLSIGYSLPKKWIKYLKMEKLRIFASGQNLYTWTKFEGDPEISVGSGENQLGNAQNFVPGMYALYSYPAVRTWMFGIDVRF